MGKHVIEQLVDDLDGTVLDSGAGETIFFALDGRSYEIDLSHTNAQQLRESMQVYVAAARSVKGHRSSRASDTRPRPSSRRGGYPLALIRQWANENGLDVPARGRVPNAVIDAYRAAN